ALTFVDVFMRYVFGRPIDGTVEITGLMMAIIVFSYTAYAQYTKTHICMDIVTGRLSPSTHAMFEFATTVWSAAIIAVTIYTIYRYGITNKKSTPILYIPYKPLILLGAGGCCLLLIALLRDILHNLHRLLTTSGTVKRIGAFLLAAIPVILAWYFITHRIFGLSSLAVGLVGIVFLFILFFMGMPIAFALMATGLIFVSVLKGQMAGTIMLGNSWFNTVSNYTWSPLMSFMLMGYACYYSRFGEDLYRLGTAWIGHMRGGLAIGSVVACTLFGAVVGDVLSGTIAMAAIALPEMKKAGYEQKLSLGTLSCSGTIGALVPPSTTFILYGVLAEQSISELFMAGFLPGVVCMLCFMAVIWCMVIRNPGLAPQREKAPREERIGSLKGGIPILLLFIIVIGGIYGGMFTASEGGAIGAAGTIILALIMRRLTWKNFIDTMVDTSRNTAMSFTLLGGATTLGYFMTMSRVPTWLASSIAGMDIAPMLVMAVIVLVICFLGCFLPAIPLILICVPIFLPIAKSFGWDLVWFGVIFAILNNMAAITPPFGINLFVMKGIAGVPLAVMFRAAMPFVLALTLCLILIIAFPQISLFLPHLLAGK
ncbi:MAG: TRAP transporter large permease subunit, partial [Mailhella sp.]|nr:TRAP transporter large permease subunit [Mailhella sp.]